MCMGRTGERMIIILPLPNTQKSNGHSISVMLIEINGDAVCLKDTYNGATVSHNVLKLGKNWGMFMAGVLPTK